MEMKVSKEKISELLELIEIPEIRQIIFAKLEQAKLIFTREIRDFYKKKYPNLLRFPGSEHDKMVEKGANNTRNRNHQDKGNRIERTVRRGFFDTTRYVDLSEDDQVAVFQEYFKNNREFRREILYEFFLKKMPYSDIYENTG